MRNYKLSAGAQQAHGLVAFEQVEQGAQGLLRVRSQVLDLGAG